MTAGYLDISLPLDQHTLVWPGEQGVTITSTGGEVGGVGYRASRLSLGSHAGTHADAPLHLGVRDAGVDQLPLDVLIGPARVCDLTGRQAIGERELAAGAGSAVRVLLKTENSRWVRSGPVPEVPAPVSLDGARYLVRSGARLVSIDGLSLDHPERVDAHLVLLSAGVVILERVDLSQVSPGEYQLICLPLRLAGADGAPARAVLRSMSQSVPAEPGT